MTFVVQDVDDPERNRTCDTRAEAEDIKSEMEGLGLDVEIIQEGTEPEVVDHTAPDPEPAAEPEPAPTPEQMENAELPEQPPVDEDPISWMPGHFIDTIEGQPAINRKGYEVLAQHFNIETRCTCVCPPEDTDFTFARHKATAITDDGREYEAHGSAHVDRGDDSFLLLEMSDTRARKRAIAQATGVGMVAVSEMQGSSEL